MSVQNSNPSEGCLVILDAGSQFFKLIDRRVRGLQVETMILPLSTSIEELKCYNIKGIIISGGPNSVYTSTLNFDQRILESQIPILGICYGMQLINSLCGGIVEKTDRREDGQITVTIIPSCKLFKGLKDHQEVLLSHGDSCSELAPKFQKIACSGQLIAGIADEARKLYGVQFHPEVDLTINGKTMLSNFLFDICGFKGTFTVTSRLQSCVQEIRDTVGPEMKVVCFVSGGVDSTVCAALLHKAIGKDRVIALHIDNGFMRKNESNKVIEALKKIGLNPFSANETYTFLASTTSIPFSMNGRSLRRASKPLSATLHPEEKRKIIGDTFIKVYTNTRIREELGLTEEGVMLAQGTLRPDLIESASIYASSKADAIKTHHNDTESVRKMREWGRIIEPLRDFHKDEVRMLGQDLNLPSNLISRHPFPGPGLAIRILCAVEPFFDTTYTETEALLKHIANFHTSILRPITLLNKIKNSLSDVEMQKLAVITDSYKLTTTLLPIKTVGVQGDCRTYSYCAALSSDDEPQWPLLLFIASIITRCCHSVNRIVYIFGGAVQYPVKDVTPTYLSKLTVDLLREADDLVTSLLLEDRELDRVSQLPVILIPIHFDRDPMLQRLPSCQRSVVLRTFLTHDFMTGLPAEPGKDLSLATLNKVVAAIQRLPYISRVLYDLTSKPPGTTEWE